MGQLKMMGNGQGDTMTVVVAPMQGVLRFVPSMIWAQPGTMINFVFGAGPHTVSKSSINGVVSCLFVYIRLLTLFLVQQDNRWNSLHIWHAECRLPIPKDGKSNMILFSRADIRSTTPIQSLSTAVCQTIVKRECS